MYSYTWDEETGGLLLNSTELKFSKEPRPVYSRELDILGFNRYWNYVKDDSAPIMWADANYYIYRGKLVAQVKGGSFFTAPEIVILEELNETLKAVDIASMVRKNADLIEKLSSETIKSVFNTFNKFKGKVDIFHVSYSGGKDSEVTLDIVQKALPHNDFVVVFGDTGMEFPDTYRSVEIAKQKCKDTGIRFYIAKSHMTPMESWNRFGPPSSTNRWCCSVHKTTPQLLLLRDVLKKTSFTEMAFVGVRADESVRRSGYDYISYGTKHRGQYSCNPILRWNSAEVYLYIYSYGLHINDGYRHGNTRAGCLVCPMSTNRNDYLNNLCYNDSTQPLLDIIGKMNISDRGKSDRIRSYIENNGWKARKNGRDLAISLKDYDESYISDKLVITFKNRFEVWRQWLKTIGKIIDTDNVDLLKIEHQENTYSLEVKSIQNGYVQIATSNNATPANVLFMKKLRKILRKSHYCVGCKVCEANCKFGNLHFDEHGIVSVSDECIKCGQCLDIDTGCFVYKSLGLSKGLGNMNKSKSLDCYAAHGPKMEWIQQFIKLGERFKSENTLGNNQVPNFYRFLRDAGVIEDERETLLAKMLKDNIDDEVVWALMLINLAYTPEVGWFVTHFGFNEFYPQTAMTNILGNTDGVSASAQKSIPAALKRFSLLPFQSVGFGITEKSSKVDGGSKYMRTPWKSVDQKVILYNLYKFAEACGDYKQFTLTRLMDSDVESDGITPTQIFGLDKETMTAVLNGLSANYPEFIHVSFTLDLDNITLSDDKTSKDVLDLFK